MYWGNKLKICLRKIKKRIGNKVGLKKKLEDLGTVLKEIELSWKLFIRRVNPCSNRSCSCSNISVNFKVKSSINLTKMQHYSVNLRKWRRFFQLKVLIITQPSHKCRLILTKLTNKSIWPEKLSMKKMKLLPGLGNNWKYNFQMWGYWEELLKNLSQSTANCGKNICNKLNNSKVSEDSIMRWSQSTKKGRDNWNKVV